MLLELLDLQPEMLEKAKQKLQARRHLNVGYTTHDASEQLPFPDESFDVAVLVAVLGDETVVLKTLRFVLPSVTMFDN